MEDVAPRPGSDETRHHLTANGGRIWPCPRCARTLHAPSGTSAVVHECSDPVKVGPHTRKAAERAHRVAVWWDAFLTAQDLAVCTAHHVPDGAYIVWPSYNGLLAVTAGERAAHVYLLSDDTPDPAWLDSIGPIARALLIARLAAWSDLLTAPQDADTRQDTRP
jgi:hypothetical protein